MTYEDLEHNDIQKQEWIWFDDATMYGSCTCINSQDTLQYLGDILQPLLDYAVKKGNTYTLTNEIVFQGHIGEHTQTPWTQAYSQFSQFAEWGFQGMPIERYKNIHQIRTSGRCFEDFTKAGIKFSHIIIVEEEKLYTRDTRE
ncbi:MAG: hypothetical protein EOP45_17750 [Sphingobacteriaceae bacterium]|nr:MAG: hypothetical protein EOP45_17750 [Sphingobacteriaceae bacterium]